MTVTEAGPQHRRRRSSTRRGFRPDIEGLRAVAVVAVVLYHAHVRALSGGYVGVDVFYVISGFLITDLLWRELGRDGRVSFAGFYARRARRLLPAAMLVLVVTVVASLAWLPPLQVASVWMDALACALYVGNYRFAFQQTNYLQASPSTSPLLHYWSLGVEEQFYVVWPLLLVAASLVWWRRRPSRAGASAALLVVSAASFGLSLWLTHANEPLAFFSLPTRAWELGLGGLLALGAPQLRHLPREVGAVLAWAGLGAIVVACFVFGSDTPFPGTAALLPVLGAGGLIAGGTTAGAAGPVVVLGTIGARAVGRISYSWYLWHYPALIIGPYAIGGTVPEWGYLLLAAGSGLLAVLTYRFVERPTRFAPWLTRSPRRSLAVGFSMSMAGVLACGAVALAVPTVTGHGRAPVAVIQPSVSSGSSVPSVASVPSVSSSAGSSATHPSGTRPSATRPSATLPPVLAAFDAAQAQVEAAVSRSVAATAVPTNLDPPLADAADSEPAPTVDGCLVGFTTVSQPTCLFGDATGSQSIVLLGDSHASMWFPAVDTYADSHRDRLYVWTKAACPPVDISLFSPVLGRTDTECAQWLAGVLANLTPLHPALVVLGIAPNYDAAYGVVQDGSSWNAGLQKVVRSIDAAGSVPVVLGSVPSPPDDIPDCLSAHPDDVARCDFPRIGHRISGGGLDGNDQPGLDAEQRAVEAAGAVYVDVEPWFCAAAVCPVVVDNLLVYRDNSHITVPYATYLTPLVADRIALALATGRTP
jgi:peptidoglycan/LPS O-acetylase OafA/YrhL